MNYALWIVQGLLALIFLFTGGMKLVLPIKVLTEQMPLPGLFVRFIGVAECAGRDWPDPPRRPAHSAGPYAAGRRGPRDHHDRRDGDHADGHGRRAGSDPAGGGIPLGVCRLRPPVLVEDRGATKMTATVLSSSQEIRDAVLKSGMEHGAAECYRKLAEMLAPIGRAGD